ncbi:50S ribosomal protein L3 [Desulfurococcus mucosus]|uniref:Large ribosomal subunit protein uL3 n=1 Tax=Desulfurococcus mucosus (strain ATCC 35584 / DSM 2162 / JCM 9187 / O7/1) TaxID=765177 RepID=E8RAP2_DESM0|nr:50S ribosomal protein L3 [Desulfurococcus mucosus]ADV65478.1 LSU ribosomal protein L3P [Desulfurococcus mucosus DSM 2162]
MGHRKLHAPRHGSLGVRPRKRAEELTPRVRRWPEKSWFDIVVERLGSEAASRGIAAKPVLLGFPVYKAGMTHAVVVEDRPNTPVSGKEVFTPVTILDAPPIVVLGVRTYVVGEDGYLKAKGEAWRSPVDAVLKAYEELYAGNPLFNMNGRDVVRKYLYGLRRLNHGLVKPDPSGEYGFKFIAESGEKEVKEVFSGEVADVRVIASTIPVFSGIGKKKPEIVELKIGGGSIDERLRYGESILGGYVKAADVFMEGQFIDVIGVTKGKGFQGVVKRFGVKELPRWHKHRKGSRKIGARSPGFGTMSEPPQAGQMGFHRRTEYNKRILRIGLNGLEATVEGGFLHYGLVYGPYLMLKGTVFGPAKRMLILRHPVRPHLEWLPLSGPRIVYLSLESKQGV